MESGTMRKRREQLQGDETNSNDDVACGREVDTAGDEQHEVVRHEGGIDGRSVSIASHSQG